MTATPSDTLPAPDPGAGLKLRLPGRRESAAAGWTWIVAGWKLFARAPLMWILAILVVFVLAIVMSLVPVAGSIAFQLLNAAISAGFVVACRSIETGGEFELEHLFAGFRSRFGSLLVVAVIAMVAAIGILFVFAAFVGLGIIGAAMSGRAEDITAMILASSTSILLGALVASALAVPLMAAYWFAPALVIMHDLSPVAAMKESFFACFRNFLPFLVYGIVMGIFAVVAAIPFGLGYLVWVPVAIASTYAAYRGIFTEPDAAEA